VKKIISAAFSAALFLAAVTPSLAADRVRIIDTGAQSWNIGGVVRVKRTVVTNPQNAAITNNVNSNTNSGGNEVQFNTKVLGDVSSGKATSYLDVYTDVNNSDIEINGCGCEEDTNVLIEQTGYQSKNVALVVDAQSISVNNTQDGRVVNNISSSANSGGNKTNYNTKVDGGVSSGNAKTTTFVDTWANTSVITINQ